MIDFVSMADHGYAKWLSLCLPSIRAAHPGARVFVFDLSPEHPGVREACAAHPGADAVAWPERQWRWPSWIDATDFDFFWPRFTLRESVKYWARRARAALTGRAKEDWMIDKAALVRSTQRFCRIVSQKPHVLLKALELSGRDLVFVDADAVVRKPLDAVFDGGLDLGVTCEPPEDVVVGPNPPECRERPSYPIRAINTGVIFLRDGAGARGLLQDWIAEMEAVRDVAAEQTALANLILRQAPDFFARHGNEGVLAARDGRRARARNLPVHLYNEYRLKPEMTSLPDEARIVHFVGSLKKQKNWPRVRELVAGP